jgi:hypothetical protein
MEDAVEGRPHTFEDFLGSAGWAPPFAARLNFTFAARDIDGTLDSAVAYPFPADSTFLWLWPQGTCSFVSAQSGNLSLSSPLRGCDAAQEPRLVRKVPMTVPRLVPNRSLLCVHPHPDAPQRTAAPAPYRDTPSGARLGPRSMRNLLQGTAGSFFLVFHGGWDVFPERMFRVAAPENRSSGSMSPATGSARHNASVRVSKAFALAWSLMCDEGPSLECGGHPIVRTHMNAKCSRK